MLLRVVGSFCGKLETGQTFSGQQCWELLRPYASSFTDIELNVKKKSLH